MNQTMPIHDPGYDWSAPSAQGAATLTPEVRKLAGEMLKSYWQYKAGEVPPQSEAPEKGIRWLRRWLRRLRETEEETVHLSLS
jgi:hypothetical protein